MKRKKSMKPKNKSGAELPDKGTAELNETDLESISGGPARRSESFGDPIGNYNFKVEIDG